MPTCKKCSKDFKNKIEIDGKIRNLQKRKFCLDCSPFNKHNTRSALNDDNTNEEKLKRKRKRWVISVTKWRRKQKLKLFAYKGGKCILCGYDKPVPGAYAFHHRDPKQKDFTISRYGHCRSWKVVKKEVDKCDLLCQNCHAEVHDKPYAKDRELTLKKCEKQNKIVKKKCIHCKKTFLPKYHSVRYCSPECCSISKRKCKRPSKEQLKKMIDEESWCAIGRKFGVSDNAVRKWARQYEII